MGEWLEKEICDTVIESRQKISCRDLVRTASRRFGADGSTVKAAIRKLVSEGTLAYTNLYGTSFLEPSFERPVRVSGRIVVKPPLKSYTPKPGEVVIEMEKGAAFGEGGHPTTRLVLDALDRAMDTIDCFAARPLRGLDVGTGTGILAIAMAKLGMEEVLGTDIDPCAIAEARHNVAINGLSPRVAIVDVPLESLTDEYMVVLANLAFPTIKSMAESLVRLTAAGGVIILSGFRSSFLPAVCATFEPHGVVEGAQSTERDWACTTWRKR